MNKIIALFLVFVSVFALFACSNEPETHHPEGVEIVKDQSSLLDVERIGNNAVVTCRVAVKNSTDKTAAVKLYANFENEYKSGMYSIDFAVAKVDGSELVAVPVGETVTVDAVFEVAFAADYVGEDLISSRELPAISINEIEIDSDLLPPME